MQYIWRLFTIIGSVVVSFVMVYSIVGGQMGVPPVFFQKNDTQVPTYLQALAQSPDHDLLVRLYPESYPGILTQSQSTEAHRRSKESALVSFSQKIPESRDVLLMLGYLAKMKHDPDEADTYAQRLLRFDPQARVYSRLQLP